MSVSLECQEIKTALKSVELAVSGANPDVHLFSNSSGLDLRSWNSFHMRYRLKEVEHASAGIDAYIPLTPLKKALSAFEDNDIISLESRDGEVLIQRGKRVVAIPISPKSAMPSWPKLSLKRVVASCKTPKLLSQALEAASVCAAADEARPLLNCVLVSLSEKSLIATDSFRLVRVPVIIDTKSEDEFLVPLQAAKAISRDIAKREMGVTLSLHSQGSHIKQGPVEMVIPDVRGQYPNWRKLLKVTPKHLLTLKREPLRDSLKAVSAIAGSVSGERQPLRLQLSQKETAISFTSVDGNRLEEEISGEYHGDELEIGLNHSLLSELTKILVSDEINFQIQSSDQAMLLKGEEREAILMPVRLSKL